MPDKVDWMRARPQVLLPSEHHLGPEMIHIVPAEMPFDEVLKPDFWCHVSRKHMRPDMIIRIVPECRSYYARVYVRSVQRLSAQVEVLEKIEFGALDPIMDAAQKEYYSEWGSPGHKWRVMRKGQDEPIKTHFPSQEAANRWIRNRANLEVA